MIWDRKNKLSEFIQPNRSGYVWSVATSILWLTALFHIFVLADYYSKLAG